MNATRGVDDVPLPPLLPLHAAFVEASIAEKAAKFRCRSDG